MPTNDAQKRAQKRYDNKTAIRLCMKLNINTDMDILQWLDHQPSKQGAIKQLIRQEIADTDTAAGNKRTTSAAAVAPAEDGSASEGAGQP